MLKTPITSKKLAALKPRQKRYSIAVGYGLSLKVQPSGTKSWVLRICTLGRVADLAIGHFPEMSLAEAKQIARRKRKELGQEPPLGYTLKDAFHLWCNLKKGRITSYADERRRLEKYVIGPLGNRQIDEITAPLMIQIVRPIETAGHRATLKRVIMRVREILDLAVCAGYIQHNPIDRLNRIFAPPVTRPMPALPWQELESIMKIMAAAPTRIQILFLWSLCSMLRPGETAKLRKDWIKEETLTIPGDQMKKRRPHRVPLTNFMLRLLAEEHKLSPHPKNAFVFSGMRSNEHMSSQKLAKYLHQTTLSGKLVAHGLRSIARSWLADHAIPFEVAESCLSHVSGSQVSRAYQRSDYLEARRPVMDAWCSYVYGCALRAGLLPHIISANEEAKEKS